MYTVQCSLTNGNKIICNFIVVEYLSAVHARKFKSATRTIIDIEKWHVKVIILAYIHLDKNDFY